MIDKNAKKHNDNDDDNDNNNNDDNDNDDDIDDDDNDDDDNDSDDRISVVRGGGTRNNFKIVLPKLAAPTKVKRK